MTVAGMRKHFVLIALVSFVAVGCSSTSKAASTTTAAGPSTAETNALSSKAGLSGTVNFDSDPTNRVATPTSGSVDVEISDFYIGPTFINAKAGSTLHVSLKNAGKVEHSFSIDAVHVDQVVAAGGTATVDVQVPASGSLRFYCKFHQSMGMQGAILATS